MNLTLYKSMGEKHKRKDHLTLYKSMGKQRKDPLTLYKNMEGRHIEEISFNTE